MRRYQNKWHKRGFSLIEVMIVLAISAGLIIIAFSTFSQRRRVASDDAANQLVSNIQAVRNEAQNGLGPTNNSTFAHNETFYGEAIQFSNGQGCNDNQPCMIVYKLKASADGQTFSAYENYQMANPNGIEFYNAPSPSGAAQNCTSNTAFLSCFTTNTYSVIVPSREFLLLIRNGSGAMYYYPTEGGYCPPVSGVYSANCRIVAQGNLRQGVVYRQNNSSPSGGIIDTTPPAGNDYTYYLNIDMTGGGSITTTRP
jgi:prepilin-type N-terminal cleavage/methylation domain-containing protein